MAGKVQPERLVELFGYDSDTKELAAKGKRGKIDLQNQRLVKEKNAGREIVDSDGLGNSCVEIDATRRPPGFDTWRLTKIDRSDQRVLIGKSYSQFFTVNEFQLDDFDKALAAFSRRKVGVKSGICHYCPAL